MDQQSLLLGLLGSGLAMCHAVVTEHGGLIASLFMAGLIGGFSHCTAMCGPFVLSQSVARLEAVPASEMRQFHRLTGALLVPYHLGRLSTYVLLGLVAGAAAGGVIDLTGLKQFSAALLAFAAVFFLGYAARQFGLPWPGAGKGGESLWSRWVGRVARPLFGRPIGLRGYGLGVALGFIPCGLLYGAIAAAAAGSGAATGAVAMAAFALGTVPSLVVVATAGQLAQHRWRATVTRLAPGLLMINAAFLSYLAWKLLA